MLTSNIVHFSYPTESMCTHFPLRKSLKYAICQGVVRLWQRIVQNTKIETQFLHVDLNA